MKSSMDLTPAFSSAGSLRLCGARTCEDSLIKMLCVRGVPKECGETSPVVPPSRSTLLFRHVQSPRRTGARIARCSESQRLKVGFLRDGSKAAHGRPLLVITTEPVFGKSLMIRLSSVFTSRTFGVTLNKQPIAFLPANEWQIGFPHRQSYKTPLNHGI